MKIQLKKIYSSPVKYTGLHCRLKLISHILIKYLIRTYQNHSQTEITIKSHEIPSSQSSRI